MLPPDFLGFSEPAKGISVGFVPQEPTLEMGLTVRENIELGVKSVMDLLKEYDEISNAMGEMSPEDMDKAMEKMGVLQDKIEAVDGWDIDTKLKVASSALLTSRVASVFPPSKAES